MAVMLNTSVGDLVIDLFVDECPVACENFLKLCSIKYYNNHLIYNVQTNYILQSGDPTGTGRGGNSIFGVLKGEDNVCFRDEIHDKRKLQKPGYIGMAHSGNKGDTNRSQFFITLRGEDMDHLAQQFTIFGEVAEGLDVLEKINTLYVDEDGRPFQDVRIHHTYILDDPYPDPPGLVVPPESPVRQFPPEEQIKRRIPYEEKIDGSFTTDGRTEEEVMEDIRRKEARSRAIMLEMLGDIPDAEVRPPAEVLFVCKLNPITRDDDLQLIFSQFGRVVSCEIIRDHKTGDSLNYAFIEFETEAACLRAYEKMNNALIDDRRIKVDFSQSVSKLWNRFLMRPRTKPKEPKSETDQKPSDNKQSIYGPAHGVARGITEVKSPEREDREKRSDRGHRRDDDDRDRDRDRKKRDRSADSDRGHHHKDSRKRHRERSRSRSRDRSRRDEDRHHRDSDRDRGDGADIDRDRHRDRDGDRDRDNSRHRDRRDHDRDRDRSSNKDSRRDHDRDRDDRRRDHDDDRDRDRNREKGRDHDKNRDKERRYDDRRDDRDSYRSEKRDRRE